MKASYQKLHRHNEPRWSTPQRIGKARIPKSLYPWLVDAASLTHRLKQACATDLTVRVMHQQRGKPLYSEREALQMASGEQGLIREVKLLCGQQSWVFARTVIPQRTLKGAVLRLTRLGNKPLGAVLFADRSMRREQLQLAAIRPGQSLHAAATQDMASPDVVVWGRRSVFYISDKPLLVSEIFIPGPERSW